MASDHRQGKWTFRLMVGSFILFFVGGVGYSAAMAVAIPSSHERNSWYIATAKAILGDDPTTWDVFEFTSLIATAVGLLGTLLFTAAFLVLRMKG